MYKKSIEKVDYDPFKECTFMPKINKYDHREILSSANKESKKDVFS